jgi:hypothetical protein
MFENHQNACVLIDSIFVGNFWQWHFPLFVIWHLHHIFLSVDLRIGINSSRHFFVLSFRLNRLNVVFFILYFGSLGWRYSDQQMRFNKYFLYEYVNWLSIASKTWHITPRTLLPFHIFLLKQWSVWAFVCRHIGKTKYLQLHVTSNEYRIKYAVLFLEMIKISNIWCWPI